MSPRLSKFRYDMRLMAYCTRFVSLLIRLLILKRVLRLSIASVPYFCSKTFFT